MIYFDNAATTLHKPPQVIEAVTKAMTTMGNCGRGAHPSSRRAAGAVYEARQKLARFFSCSREDHVVFTANATHSLNLAICGLFSPGDHVITTVAEHNSVLRPLYRLEGQIGLQTDYIPTDAKGVLQLSKLEEFLRPNTKAVICTHMSNVTGNITDLETVSAFTKKHGLLLVVDGSQSAGYLPISMKEMAIDILCVTGHKGLLGPQGTGCLLLREGISLRPLTVGGSGVQSYLKEQPPKLPEALEAGTLNTHGIAGLSAAMDYLEEMGLEVIKEKEDALTRYFYENIRHIDGIRIHGDPEGSHGPIVALNLPNMDSATLADCLAEDYGIATRPGAHCAPLMHKALGTDTQGLVRFSFSHFNTCEEVDLAVTALKELRQQD
ncbi:MAG: aminotransferase class V-fold PLP-dependent enzyme [Oscillospiraceae bacterium]|nr:aminotransferase class V-fold PLP-dependent enzyme [Oscillospiraceae bacterium]